MELAVALCLVATVSYYVTGPLIVALFTVAVHRPFRTVAFVGGLAIASGFVSSAVHPDPGLDYFASVLIGATLINRVIAWGMYVRSRRQLLVSLHERARRAESEAALRAERAQRLTRERIAREMHDVLAHRLSLLSVHAGALEYRTDVSPEELAKAAGVIRNSAHQALEDLREVIGVLRAPGGEEEDGAEGRTATGPAWTARRPALRPRSPRRPASRHPVPGVRLFDIRSPAPGSSTSGLSAPGPPAPVPPARPQPTLADLPRLVEESRRAGMRVTLCDQVVRADGGAADGLPSATGRTAYRIVQEGLTNARKHAPRRRSP
ncbi:histidine kinase [Streptomyces sp. M19]